MHGVSKKVSNLNGLISLHFRTNNLFNVKLSELAQFLTYFSRHHSFQKHIQFIFNLMNNFRCQLDLKILGFTQAIQIPQYTVIH